MTLKPATKAIRELKTLRTTRSVERRGGGCGRLREGCGRRTA